MNRAKKTTASTSESPLRPIVVYFDMNVWVNLARRADPELDEPCSAHQTLRTMVDRGQLRVVLSSGHYLELWHRRTQGSREDVGRLMRDLSGYATFAPLEAIRKLEVDAMVSRHAGRERSVAKDDVLGHGASHAFGSRFGRFRFVESLASMDGTTPEGSARAAPDEWANLTLEGPSWEWLNLVGTQEILDHPGLERRPQHRLGNARQKSEEERRQELSKESSARARLRDLIIREEIEVLTDAIHQACWGARVQPRSLFMENSSFESPAEARSAFVAGLPTVDTLVTLREWKHRDLTHPWDQHDQTDLLTLSIAIPYADFVVTERRWAHISRASGLARKYGTDVSALRDLDKTIVRITANARP